MQPQTHKNTPIKALNGLKHVKKCRNDVLKYGYDSRKNDSVMACFVRGGVKAHPPAAFIPFYRLQIIGLKQPCN